MSAGVEVGLDVHAGIAHLRQLVAQGPGADAEPLGRLLATPRSRRSVSMIIWNSWRRRSSPSALAASIATGGVATGGAAETGMDDTIDCGAKEPTLMPMGASRHRSWGWTMPPCWRISARWMALSSSRTLPGQGWRNSASRASRERQTGAWFILRTCLASRRSARGRMSAGRSRKARQARGKTESR